MDGVKLIPAVAPWRADWKRLWLTRLEHWLSLGHSRAVAARESYHEVMTALDVLMDGEDLGADCPFADLARAAFASSLAQIESEQ